MVFIVTAIIRFQGISYKTGGRRFLPEAEKLRGRINPPKADKSAPTMGGNMFVRGVLWAGDPAGRPYKRDYFYEGSRFPSIGGRVCPYGGNDCEKGGKIN